MKETMNNFELIGRRFVPMLGAEALLYRHSRLGTRHLHLATQDPEMGFLVGFPTIPRVGDGRAHILEHIVLSGSERFPVRDPFFSMMRRSVATFMNAMTYPDRTVYPFATTDSADYFNLLDVYLDAAFFPKLERVSFLQEGWRPAIENGRYAIQGVVFNEMKANYADADRALYMGLTRELYEGTHYAEDSGGDPLLIPNLAYETLRQFHAEHYHGSQAVFFSSGAVDPVAVQVRIESQVLGRFSASVPRILPDLAEPFSPRELARRSVAIRVPVSPGAADSEHGLQLAWRFDAVATQLEKLRHQAVFDLLAGHDGAPLMQAILGLGFGRPSGTMGPDISARQIAVHFGVSGLRPEQLSAAREAITRTLRVVAEEGLPVEEIESVLRKLEFRHRQPRSSVYRLLELAETGLRDEDLLAAVDVEPALEQLAKEMRAPRFMQRALQELLDCPNQLEAHIQPDEQYFAVRDAAELALIRARDAALSDLDRQSIAADNAALIAHQANAPIGTDTLPRVRPADLSREPKPLPEMRIGGDDAALCVSAVLPTQGLSHCDLVIDVSAFALWYAPWLSLLADLLPQLGAGGRGYASAAAWRESEVQSFGVYLQTRVGNAGDLQVELVYSAASLPESVPGISRAISAWYAAPELEDRERVLTLLRNHIQVRVANLQAAAEVIAAATLRSGLSAQGDWDARTQGLPALDFLLSLEQQLAEGELGLNAIIAGLQEVLRQVHAAPRHVLWASGAVDAERYAAEMHSTLPSRLTLGSTIDPVAPLDAGSHLALVAEGQTQACGSIWSVPREHEAEGPALAVAAQLLTQQFLHALVREKGGAYGVSARYSGTVGVFVIESHADPRLAGTYADYALALDQLQNVDITDESLEEAIVSVIKHLDKPVLPAQRLRMAWDAKRRGQTDGMRQRFRSGVLECSLADVRRVASSFLRMSQARRVAAVAGSTEDLDGLAPVDLRVWAQRFAASGVDGNGR